MLIEPSFGIDRDVDDGRLELRGEIGKAGRGTRAGDHLGDLLRVVLGDLRARGIAGDERQRATGEKEG